MVSDGPDEARMTGGGCLGNLEEADQGPQEYYGALIKEQRP